MALRNRLHRRNLEDDDAEDARTRYQHDRDRILYSGAFRRLAGVTQVVGSGEGHVFHNRLTHTLRVAQVARRLAERTSAFQRELAAAARIDQDVAESAALAHDLGHPRLVMLLKRNSTAYCVRWVLQTGSRVTLSHSA